MNSHEKIDIVPLQTEADEVANMQSYLREWDRMLEQMKPTLDYNYDLLVNHVGDIVFKSDFKEIIDYAN